MDKIEMIKKKSWEQFRDAGLFWFVNRTLHMFGWVLVWECDDEESLVRNVYPARTRFRGFEHEVEERGFQKLTRWMKDHAEDLLNETEE